MAMRWCVAMAVERDDGPPTLCVSARSRKSAGAWHPAPCTDVVLS